MSPPLLYLDQNYLSGIAKRKPAFVELEPVVRAAVEAGAVAVVESPVHQRESAPRPDLRLLELLHELSHGRALPAPGVESRHARQRLQRYISDELPQRAASPSDSADLEAIATALPHCGLLTCDAFMADVVRRTKLDRRYRTELFTGRRPDVLRLAERLRELAAARGAAR
jgi:hypothetical protein